jgi:hypothetical protein
MFMKRLFGGATLLCAAFSADAGLIRTDFSTDFRTDFRTGAGLPGYGSFGAGDELAGSTYLANELANELSTRLSTELSNGSGWESGEAWLDPVPATGTPTLQAQQHVDFQVTGPALTGIAFQTEPPAEDPTPIPEPETLALFGLGAGALGLARQGKNKRA